MFPQHTSKCMVATKKKTKRKKKERIVMALFSKMNIPKYMNAKNIGQASGASNMWSIDAKYKQEFRNLATKANLIVDTVPMGVVK